MESLARHTPRPAVTHRCGICHRPIKPDSKSLPVFGRVGPECLSKHAALIATLKREGLEEFLDGPITFEPIESEDANGNAMWVYPTHIDTLMRRAQKLGFSTLKHWRVGETATLELKVPANDKQRRNLMNRLDRLVAAA